MGSQFNPSNKYNSTPRKVFDKHVDRMELRRQRDRLDHRADTQALIKRLMNLEALLTQLHKQVQDHCDLPRRPPKEFDNLEEE